MRNSQSFTDAQTQITLQPEGFSNIENEKLRKSLLLKYKETSPWGREKKEKVSCL